jgi:hypothetical protein
MGYWIHVFLNSALVGSECSYSRPCCFTSARRASDAHQIRGWGGHKTSLDNVERGKIVWMTHVHISWQIHIMKKNIRWDILCYYHCVWIKIFEVNEMAQAAKLVNWIREVFTLNLARSTCCYSQETFRLFLSPSRKRHGLKSDADHCFHHPFQFIVYSHPIISFYIARVTTASLNILHVIKQNKGWF